MKKILITGASGFIGSFLTEEAVARGWQIWVGVRRSSSREYLADSRIQFVDLNYSDKETLKKQIREHGELHGRWDYIIHNAGVTKCLRPEDFDRVNYLFTKHFIEALQETGLVPEKFILMSSLSAFPDPETAYGQSKRKAELFLESQSGFPFIILRPTGVYGPREKDYFLMIKSVQAGLEVAAGFKPQQLTFIYVKDLVKAVFLCLESSLTHKAYAVADGNVYSDEEYTEIVKRTLGKKCVLKIKVPLWLLKIISVVAGEISKMTGKPSTLNRDKFKIMKQRDWTCDTLPLEKDLHFKADYDLVRGMKECVDWYRENQWL